MRLKQEPAILGMRAKEYRIAMLAMVIGPLAVIGILQAWEHGIIASAVYALRPVVAGIWEMLRDLADACGDFLEYVRSVRNH